MPALIDVGSGRGSDNAGAQCPQRVESRLGKAAARLLTTRHDRETADWKLPVRLLRVSSAGIARRRSSLSLRSMPPRKRKRLFRQHSCPYRSLGSGPQPSARHRIPVLTRSMESILLGVRIAALLTRRVGPRPCPNTPWNSAEGDPSQGRCACLGRFNGGMGLHC